MFRSVGTRACTAIYCSSLTHPPTVRVLVRRPVWCFELPHLPQWYSVILNQSIMIFSSGFMHCHLPVPARFLLIRLPPLTPLPGISAAMRLSVTPKQPECCSLTSPSGRYGLKALPPRPSHPICGVVVLMAGNPVPDAAEP